MFRFARLILALSFFLPLPAVAKDAPVEDATLIVEVTGLRSGKGDVHYAVYDSPEKFSKRKGRVSYGNVPAKAGGVAIQVKGLKRGTYAVAVFHDENRNDEFDQGLLGIPLEDYGFSNNASGFLGPPSFKDAAVILNKRTVRTVIRLD